ncbi:MAG TPA: DNA ligase D [Solirubrobacteraceae bacterium]|jgi:bifunctional non-homologous end joining protein LigD|nr:DNA ligase D [Solirubrobacteraceae bacterium]
MTPAKRSGGSSQKTRLSGYRGKRDFASTPEPTGDEAVATGRPRFVIQEHSATRLHWDLRLERDGALASFAIPKGLPEAPKDNRLAVRTEDHPLEYLDFKGEIPKGQYGAGTMKIWDRGTYDCLKWEPRKIEVWLHGERLDARYALFPIDKDEQPKNWMIHRMDPPADPDREPMPAHVKPMLARQGELPADQSNWAFEVKWDGVRAIAYSQPGELRLESRNLKDITDSYPELARLNRALSSHSAVLDGEIVAFDQEGRPSFGALQPRMHVGSRAQAKRLAAATPVTYVIFDLLWLDGHSLMGLPYTDRRERLAELQLSGERWQTPEHVIGEGSALLEVTRRQDLEGIVAKRLSSTYQPGARTRDWIKVKSFGRQEFVIGGWLPGKGRRRDSIGALLLGVYEPDGRLRYVGRVGTGFGEKELERLAALLSPLQRDGSPFDAGEKPPREAVFVEPRLVAEVEFREWTRGGNLRQPSYKGLREDKRAEEVVREDRKGAVPGEEPAEEQATLSLPAKPAKSALVAIEGRELKLSNLEKVLYPATGFSKRDLIEYYAAIAPTILPHLQGRALTVTRWPDGVQGKSFFQKQTPAHAPDWVRTVTLPSERKPIDYTLVEDLATLVWLANLAAIELHTPLARAEDVERPTMLVFDLDPGAPATIVECCRVARQLQGMFENLGLQSFAKTSGSKGLQLYVPLNSPDVTFAQTKPFAKAVAELLEAAEPDLVVSRMTKARRAGKVLIDWSQNDRNKTTVCVYSLRATERPTASTPLDWDEVAAALDAGDPEMLAFEAHTVRERIAERGDLFAPVLSVVQTLPEF